jgi:hypothetical protein
MHGNLGRALILQKSVEAPGHGWSTIVEVRGSFERSEEVLLLSGYASSIVNILAGFESSMWVAALA